MIIKTIIGSETVSGLRTRFIPRSRIGQGLITIAPWADIFLLILFFVFLNARFVLQPGVRIELPTGSFNEGSKSSVVAVLKSVDSLKGSQKEEILFFDDERFIVRDEDQLMQFMKRLSDMPPSKTSEGLVLYADREVSHGTVTRVLNLARQTGIPGIILAVDTDRNAAAESSK